MKSSKNIMIVVSGIYLFLGILLMIEVSWVAYEVLRFGESIADPFHLIIAIILSTSITSNIILFIKRVNP